ncbi:hypothetical protein EYF80_012991 [Liparis tanakae]|uniref:Uncharacterized protein n=1 Tax=Liparis tanakae TaxID=230148 RepID=A0A4Z2IHD9_9TELE|nr:hypothetical protein EYF80_012991 [Liparis tanakae]
MDAEVSPAVSSGEEASSRRPHTRPTRPQGEGHGTDIRPGDRDQEPQRKCLLSCTGLAHRTETDPHHDDPNPCSPDPAHIFL